MRDQMAEGAIHEGLIAYWKNWMHPIYLCGLPKEELLYYDV